VGGEEGGRQRTALDPHGGEDGESHGQGAAAKAGEIVNGGDTGSGHGRIPLFYGIRDFVVVLRKKLWYNKLIIFIIIS
jgi:hypothetical protein